MNHFTKSLRFKVTLLVITVELLIFSGVGVFYTHRFSQEIDNAIIARLSIPGLLMTRGELSFEAVSDKRTMEGLLREPYREGNVIGLDGNVYFSSKPARLDTHLDAIDGLKLPGPESSTIPIDAPDLITPLKDSTGTYLTCLSPLRPNGKLTGYLYLKVGTEISEAAKRKVSILFAIGSLGTITLTAAILSWLLNLMVIRRLNYLVEIFRRFALGDYAARAQPLGRDDEIGTLMNGFNGLAKRLEDTMAHLSEDITERKRAEEDLKRMNERFFLATHAAQLGVWDWDIPKNELVWDDSMYRLYGIQKGYFGGAYDAWVGTIHPQDKVHTEGEIQAALRGEREYGPEFRIVRPDGTIRYIKADSQTFRDENGKPLRMIGTNIDITERKLSEEEIHRLNAELEQRVIERTAQLEAANKELEAFCYSVSHDLRAPLRHIDGYVDLLVSRCRDGLNDQGLHYVETIADSARQMGVLIDDLLQFSRTGRAELRRESVAMDRALQEALVPLQESCAGRTIEWVIDELPPVWGDYALLRQVWANLLGNAIKYSRTRESARIAVSAREGDNETIFVVADNGVGFDMRYAGKLFGVFQRLHSQEEFEGTGIGLATVQRIIKRHGGRVRAEAEPDKGATFYFTLPTYKEEHHA